MVYDGDVLSFGELRKALKIAFPDQPQNERDLLMLILWGAVLSNRMQSVVSQTGSVQASDR